MYEKVTLPSGLRIILVPLKHVQSVSVQVFIGVGSHYEKQHQIGISHFLEHIFFKGTKKRPTPRAISATIDSIGGDLNAGTSKNYTFFSADVASNHFETGLGLLADILTNSKFNPKEIDRERGVILEENQMGYDDAAFYAWQLYERLIWGDTPHGQVIGGIPERIRNFRRKDFISYMKSLYTFDNIIIGIGGNFDKQKAIHLTTKLFNKFNPRKHTKVAQNLNGQTKPQFVFHDRDTESAYAVLGFRAFSYYHPDAYPLLLLDVLLGGNMSSRLFIAVREEMGLAYTIGSAITQYSDVGTLTIHTALKAAEAKKGIERILKELLKLKHRKVSPKELLRAKDFLKGRFARIMDHPATITDYLCMQELLIGYIQKTAVIYEKIDRVTADNVRRVAGELFRPEKLNLAMVGPIKKIKAVQNLVAGYL